MGRRTAGSRSADGAVAMDALVPSPVTQKRAHRSIRVESSTASTASKAVIPRAPPSATPLPHAAVADTSLHVQESTSSADVAVSSSVDATESGRKATVGRKMKLDVASLTPWETYSESSHCVGCHVAAAGGLWNAVVNAHAVKARAFAFFPRSRGRWDCPPMLPADAPKFKALCEQLNFPPSVILPHGTYLTNAGSGDEALRSKSVAALIDECQRVSLLGLTMYNFHPGSAGACASKEECCDNVSHSINAVHAAVPHVCVVIETMAGQGSSVGSTFAEIKRMIDGVVDKSRVGVCLDTAHLHGAGYDVRTASGYEAVMQDFISTVGLEYLRGMHLNDSAVGVGSRVDRHWHIGRGEVGVEAFRCIMNDSRLAGLPLILETPAGSKPVEKYRDEIELCYLLQGREPGSGAPSGHPTSSNPDVAEGKRLAALARSMRQANGAQKGKQRSGRKASEESSSDGEDGDVTSGSEPECPIPVASTMAATTAFASGSSSDAPTKCASRAREGKISEPATCILTPHPVPQGVRAAPKRGRTVSEAEGASTLSATTSRPTSKLSGSSTHAMDVGPTLAPPAKRYRRSLATLT